MWRDIIGVIQAGKLTNGASLIFGNDGMTQANYPGSKDNKNGRQRGFTTRYRQMPGYFCSDGAFLLPEEEN
jgi:hypothetical protein